MPNGAHLFIIDCLIYLSSEAKSRCLGQTAEIKKRSPMLRLFVVPLINRESGDFSLFVNTLRALTLRQKSFLRGVLHRLLHLRDTVLYRFYALSVFRYIYLIDALAFGLKS